MKSLCRIAYVFWVKSADNKLLWLVDHVIVVHVVVIVIFIIILIILVVIFLLGGFGTLLALLGNTIWRVDLHVFHELLAKLLSGGGLASLLALGCVVWAG